MCCQCLICQNFGYYVLANIILASISSYMVYVELPVLVGRLGDSVMLYISDIVCSACSVLHATHTCGSTSVLLHQPDSIGINVCHGITYWVMGMHPVFSVYCTSLWIKLLSIPFIWLCWCRLYVWNLGDETVMVFMMKCEYCCVWDVLYVSEGDFSCTVWLSCTCSAW